MGPTSWFAGIEDSAIPKANMDVKIVVSTKGMENLRNFHLEWCRQKLKWISCIVDLIYQKFYPCIEVLIECYLKW